jgi:hypothetical protein
MTKVMKKVFLASYWLAFLAYFSDHSGKGLGENVQFSVLFKSCKK